MLDGHSASYAATYTLLQQKLGDHRVVLGDFAHPADVGHGELCVLDFDLVFEGDGESAATV